MPHSKPTTMTTQQTLEQVKAIKRSFRLRMNGDASRAMREKGVDYKLNWGLSLPDLKAMAKELGQDYDLAVELWKEPVRECRLLATLVMPHDCMTSDLVEVWMEQVETRETVEHLAHHLLRHLAFAPELAFRWIASERPLYQLAGYDTLAGLFANGQEPNERGINEFLDQAQATLEGGDISLRRAAFNCVMRFCDLGESYEQLARKALPDVI